MPEGLTSIDDMKVVITAETERLTQGLANAHEVIRRFGSDAGGVLGAFDAILVKAGSGAQALQANLVPAFNVLSTAVTLFKSYGEEAQRLANAAGVGEEFAELSASMSGFGDAALVTLTAVRNHLVSVGTEAARSANAIDAAGSGSGAKRFGAGEYVDQVAHATRSSEVGLRVLARHLGDTSALTGEALDKAEATTRRNLANTARDIAEYEQRWTGFWSYLASPVLAANREMEQIFRDRLATIEAWKKQEESTRAWQGIAIPTGVLAGETASLERKIALLGASNSEIVRYDARLKLLQATERAGVEVTADVLRVINEEADAQAARQARIDAYSEAKKKEAAEERERTAAARDAERREERRERGVENLLGGLDNDVAQLRAKAAASKDVTVAERALAIETDLLNRARRSGIELTDDEIIKTKALANSKAQLEDAARRVAETYQQINQATGIVFKGVETVLSRSLDGVEIKRKEVTAAVLKDLEMLILRMMVLKPLQDSLSQGITSAFGGGGGGGGLGGFLGSLFGGARAEGGPVGAGKAYLVGERGPELFMPGASGTVIPNKALGAAPVHVTIANHIDARGAYPESIAEIRRAIADQQQGLPGRVLEVVNDAKERGGI